MPRIFEMPTEAEEAAIQAGIAADPDNPEWTKEDFASAVRAAEILPERARRTGAPGPRVTSMPLDADVLQRLRATGPGWQARANELLRKALFG